MNITENRKKDFKFIGTLLLALSVIVAVVGVVLLVTCLKAGELNKLKLVFGIILTVSGLLGLCFGIFLSKNTSSEKIENDIDN